MSLDELRAYITQHKHLPNIPSAEEIGKDGLNLSQFQMLLLEKVEELTLYTLAQQEEIGMLQTRTKRLESIQAELAHVKAENAEIKRKMAQFEGALQKLGALTAAQANHNGRTGVE